jgi:hypothetical protein
MRFPWPDHVNANHLIFFATALLVAQLLSGTNPLFAICIFFYVLLAGTAFNYGGGLYTFTGSFIAFQSLEVVIISQIAKVIFWQPADSNLQTPMHTAEIYVAGMAAECAAVIVCSKYRRKEPFFDSRKDESRMMEMSIAGSLIGIVSSFLLFTLGLQETGGIQQASIWGYLNQLQYFTPLGVMLGTAYLIRQSGGKRSARWWTLAPIVYMSLQGVALNSKQGIFQPFFMWFIVCVVYRYKFSKTQIAGMVAYIIFGAYIIFPVVQYSRAYVREGNLIQRAVLVYQFTTQNGLIAIRDAYISDAELQSESATAHFFFYYGRDMQLLDRFSLIETEDAVIRYSERVGFYGLQPFEDEMISMVPRFIMPNKDQFLHISMANVLGRATGMLGPEDEQTFISFSMFATTYFMAGWGGVTALVFAVMAVYFTVIDSFYGNAKQSYYALLVIVGNIHAGPEFMLPVVISSAVHLILLVWIVLKIMRWASPVVGLFVKKYGLKALPPSSKPGVGGAAPAGATLQPSGI